VDAVYQSSLLSLLLDEGGVTGTHALMLHPGFEPPRPPPPPLLPLTNWHLESPPIPKEGSSFILFQQASAIAWSVFFVSATGRTNEQLGESSCVIMAHGLIASKTAGWRYFVVVFDGFGDFYLDTIPDLRLYSFTMFNLFYLSGVGWAECEYWLYSAGEGKSGRERERERRGDI
jgi:hypothetical protein